MRYPIRRTLSEGVSKMSFAGSGIPIIGRKAHRRAKFEIRGIIHYN
jgi:hypothetical protein